MGHDAKSDGKGKSNPNGLRGDLDDVRWCQEKRVRKREEKKKKKQEII